ncbi:hypothetical protein [Oenococcus oeni]|uniref:Cell envelope-related transcriptional attenuator domain-containing protein n=1 Tax=Oenococcus oeni AWRIB429 TaxID=655225 RepID=D3LBZ3_OENOE|nr:hypothetical protein [Oenococcus oeni]AWW98828.1 hypothetical protein C5H79_04620 [Oenococcus oeni]EFD87599.1 hypothetical protein AWRIB429_1873 [Oenococcus oeni AWRIB429]MDQ8695788.1 hypothetical protein [Oenococcus oeni]MDQ8718096.1 hypothetical protein [Oenococcus oeni]MDS0175763.1 hypothetical protein [Oenococcus oeni]
MHKIRKISLFVIFILLIFVGYKYLSLSGLLKKTNISIGDKSKSVKNNSTLSSKKPFSVLLLGTDTGDLGRTDKGRTDTLMIVTVNPKKRLLRWYRFQETQW